MFFSLCLIKMRNKMIRWCFGLGLITMCNKMMFWTLKITRMCNKMRMFWTLKIAMCNKMRMYWTVLVNLEGLGVCLWLQTIFILNSIPIQFQSIWNLTQLIWNFAHSILILIKIETPLQSLCLSWPPSANPVIRESAGGGYRLYLTVLLPPSTYNIVIFKYANTLY